MKHIFIVNPHAGARSCEEMVRKELQRFSGIIDYDIYLKQHKGDSREVVRRYRAMYPDEPLRFYACGGDGTLREVAIACIGVEDVAFTAFAQGSGNDYVKYYGGADNFRNIGRLIEGIPTPIDMMRIRSTRGNSAGEEVTWAMNATHFGLDAQVAKTMDVLRRMPLIGKGMAYPTGVVWGFLTGMKNACTVWADGVRISQQVNGRSSECRTELAPVLPSRDGQRAKLNKSMGQQDTKLTDEERNATGQRVKKSDFDRILLCTAANGTHVGGSYCCAPRSQNDDGLLEVCLVSPIGRLKFLRLMNGYKAGTHLDDPRFAPYITYLRARSLTIEGPKGFCVSLDGELLRASHIEVENIPQALTFIKPADR